jgi:hypothetical protein
MKIQAIAFLVFILQQSAISIPQQATPKGSIGGRVTRAGTGEAILGARVILQTSGGQERTTLSNQSGNFIISDLDAGEYQIAVTANGYVRQEYRQRFARGSGTYLSLAAGQTLKGIDFELTPAGYVSGGIRDNTDRPLKDLRVQLLQVTYSALGRRSLHSAALSVTNERGEYRFPSVTPGRYYVAAGSAAGQLGSGPPPREGSPDSVQESYALTYYPGVLNPQDAAIIDVQPGQDLAAVNFTVYSQKRYKLRGRVIDSRTGQQPEAASIVLQYETFTGEGISSPFNVSYDATNGKFEIRNVVPGSYMVEARIPEKNRPDSPSSDSRASMAVTIADSDIDGVIFVAYPPASIQGRLTVDGQELSTIPDFARIRVRLVGLQSPASAQSQTLNPDGTFRIDNVRPGPYQVMVCLGFPGNSQNCARSTPDFYLKYAQFDRSDVLNTPLHFDGTIPTPLDIVLSPKPGQIEGTVMNEKQLPVAGIQVVLIPDQNRHRFDLYKFGTSDRSGHFTIRGVTPGSYKIFAWEALEENAYFDSDLMQRFDPYGKPVHVEEADQLKTDIKVIPAGK